MAQEELKKIFLSASIPMQDRDPKYYKTADVIAIRDAVIALATIVLPNFKLVWGGHPSITPIIYLVMERLNLNIQEHVTLYQSKYFEKFFPEDNNKFKNVVLTENKGEKQLSVNLMRERIFSENNFSAGIFIGGMEGTEIEFKMFREFHPNAILLPIASTGAASLIIYNELLPEDLKNSRMINDFGYLSLFQDLLIAKI